MADAAEFSFERLDHFQLATPADADDRSREFWCGLLGLTEIPKPPVLAAGGGAWFQGGGVAVHVGADPEFRPALRAHPALRVRGLEALAARLEAHGHPVTWSHDIPGQDRFHSADPFGNLLEFLELHEGSAE